MAIAVAHLLCSHRHSYRRPRVRVRRLVPLPVKDCGFVVSYARQVSNDASVIVSANGEMYDYRHDDAYATGHRSMLKCSTCGHDLDIFTGLWIDGIDIVVVRCCVGCFEMIDDSDNIAFSVGIVKDFKFIGVLDTRICKGEVNENRMNYRSLFDCLWHNQNRVVYRDPSATRLIEASISDIRAGNLVCTREIALPQLDSITDRLIANYCITNRGKEGILLRNGYFVLNRGIVRDELVGENCDWLLIEHAFKSKFLIVGKYRDTVGLIKLRLVASNSRINQKAQFQSLMDNPEHGITSLKAIKRNKTSAVFMAINSIYLLDFLYCSSKGVSVPANSIGIYPEKTDAGYADVKSVFRLKDTFHFCLNNSHIPRISIRLT